MRQERRFVGYPVEGMCMMSLLDWMITNDTDTLYD